jgi:hypothetical protein
MALSRNATQILWASAVTKTVSSNSATTTSDAFTFDSTDVAALITLYASTAGTPATGDTIDFYIAWSTGDALGAGGADTFDATEHAQFLCRLDNYATDTPGEQPAQRTIPIPVAAKSFKIIAVTSAAAATRNQTFAARVLTQRAA